MSNEVKPNINIELLEKIDIRVGTIISVDDIAKSDKKLECPKTLFFLL